MQVKSLLQGRVEGECKVKACYKSVWTVSAKANSVMVILEGRQRASQITGLARIIRTANSQHGTSHRLVGLISNAESDGIITLGF